MSLLTKWLSILFPWRTPKLSSTTFLAGVLNHILTLSYISTKEYTRRIGAVIYFIDVFASVPKNSYSVQLIEYGPEVITPSKASGGLHKVQTDYLRFKRNFEII